MTDKEKKQNPEHKTTGGYLKTNNLKEEYKRCFDEATKKDIKKTLAMPNFDFKIFKEITGITKQMLNNKLKEVKK